MAQLERSTDVNARFVLPVTNAFSIKQRTSNSSGKTKHTLEREPHLPIYSGVNVNAQARNKTLIQQLYQMGISISYDRVKQLEEWIAISVCARFEEDGVVFRICLRKGLFTVGALDNIDHNPSSTTSLTSFHGTGISLFQFPTKTKTGESRPPVKIPPSGTKRHSFPDKYASVPAVVLTTTTIAVPRCSVRPVQTCLDKARAEKNSWVEHCHLYERRNSPLKIPSCGLLTMRLFNLPWKTIQLFAHSCLCSTRSLPHPQ